MNHLVYTQLRDSALEGTATGSAIGCDLIGRVFALRVTDMEKLLFYSTCFSSAPGTAPLLLEKVFWFALPVLVFLLDGFRLMKTLLDFPRLQNDKGQVQSSPNTGSKSKSGNNPSTSKHK